MQSAIAGKLNAMTDLTTQLTDQLEFHWRGQLRRIKANAEEKS